MYPEDLIREFDSSYEKAEKTANNRPWARPARLPDHPQTRSDRHPEDPRPHDELFIQYF